MATLAFTKPEPPFLTADGREVSRKATGLFTILVGVTLCTCLSTMAELTGLPLTIGDKWLGLAGSAGLDVMLIPVPGLLGNLGVLAGELVLVFLAGDVAELREDFRAGEPLDRNGGREVRSSSDFFRPVLLRGVSKELDLDVGRLYRLEVDLALVIPDFAPNFLEEPGPDPASKSFLVCLTMSGAGSSLSLTPNITPVEALLEGRVLAPP